MPTQTSGEEPRCEAKWRWWKDKSMNTQPLEMVKNVSDTENDVDVLAQNGFTDDEIISLSWLRQWYQNGGSDRTEVIRYLEFLKLLVLNGKMEP